MKDFNKKYDSLAEAAKEILDENRYKNMSVDEVGYWRLRELIDTLSKQADTLKTTYKSNKRISKTQYKNMSVDEKAYWRLRELIDTLSDTLKTGSKSNKTQREEVNFNRDTMDVVYENQYRNMSVDDVTRAVDALSNVLRKGSNLNKHINKTRGGPGVNFDRDFKELKDAMDEVYEKWEDLVWRASQDD